MLLELMSSVLLRNVTHGRTHGRTDARTHAQASERADGSFAGTGISPERASERTVLLTERMVLSKGWSKRTDGRSRRTEGPFERTGQANGQSFRTDGASERAVLSTAPPSQSGAAGYPIQYDSGVLIYKYNNK